MVGLALAIPTALTTIVRFGARARARNLGLDDAFAASSLVGLLVNYTALFLHFDLKRTLPPSLVLFSDLEYFIILPGLAHYSFTARYVMYYIISIGFYWIIW